MILPSEVSPQRIAPAGRSAQQRRMPSAPPRQYTLAELCRATNRLWPHKVIGVGATPTECMQLAVDGGTQIAVRV